MKTKSIRQTTTVRAQPKDVYDLFMNSKKHSALTGTAVKVSKKTGGTFQVFDGYCHGYNIELIEGKKIVQAWHFAEDGWPEDHFSVCTLRLAKSPLGTQLTFVQTGIPAHKAADLRKGWREFYWQPIKKYFSSPVKSKRKG